MIHRFFYTIILLLSFLFFYSNSFAVSLSSYTLIIEDSRNILQSVIVVLTDEDKHSQELQFEKQGQYWIAIASLAERVTYSYSAQVGEYEISDSFRTDVSRSIELFSYNPPAERCKMTIKIDDCLQKKYKKLFFSINADLFGNYSERYREPVEIISNNSLFQYEMFVEKKQCFSINILTGQNFTDDKVVVFSVCADQDKMQIEHKIAPFFSSDSYNKFVPEFPPKTIIEFFEEKVMGILLIFLVIELFFVFKYLMIYDKTEVEKPKNMAFISIITALLYWFISLFPVYVIKYTDFDWIIEKNIWSVPIMFFVSDFIHMIWSIVLFISVLIAFYSLRRIAVRFTYWIIILSGMFFWIFKTCFHHGECGTGEYIRQPLANTYVHGMSLFIGHFLPQNNFYFNGLDSIIVGVLTVLIIFKLIMQIFQSNRQRWTAFIVFFSGYGYIQLYCGHFETSGFVSFIVTLYVFISILCIHKKLGVLHPIICFILMICAHISTLAYFPTLLYIMYVNNPLKIKRHLITFGVLLFICAAVGIHQCFLFSIPLSIKGIMLKLFASLQCIFFIHPLAVLMIILILIFRKKFFYTTFCECQEFCFCFIGTVSFSCAVFIANENFSHRTYHTFAHMGIFMTVMIFFGVLKQKITFPLLPVFTGFGIPFSLMFCQHAGFYPYGKVPNSHFVPCYNVKKYTVNKILAERMENLVKTGNEDIRDFMYSKYGRQVFLLADPDIYRKYEVAESPYENMFFGEYEKYRLSGRYNPQIFIDALEAKDFRYLYSALNLLAQMRVVESGIAEAVRKFSESDDLRFKSAAKTILLNREYQEEQAKN